MSKWRIFLLTICVIMGALACLHLYGYRMQTVPVVAKARWMAMVLFSVVGGVCCFVRIPKHNQTCQTVSAEALAQKDIVDRFARAGGYVLLGVFGAI